MDEAVDPRSRAALPRTPEEGARDLAVVRACASGDETARRVLGRRLSCVPGMLRGLGGELLSVHDLEDLAQDVRLTCWSRLESFRGEGTLEAWVSRICANKLLNARARIRVHLRPPDELDGLVTPDWDLQSGSTADFDLLLGSLRPEEASVLRERLLQGRSSREIGAARQWSVSKVKRVARSGLLRLRRRFGGPRSEDGEVRSRAPPRK